MKPEQSLDVLAGILQQIALPAVAPNGQLSHAVIANHLQTIATALQPEPETNTVDKTMDACNAKLLSKEQPCSQSTL